MAHSPDQAPAAGDASLALEAARYALLRRLAYAIRHDLMAHLQPVTMAGEVLERRLRMPSPELDKLRDGVARVTSLSRTAVQSCLDVVTWLTPETGRSVSLGALVEETVGLLGSSFGFRGFSLHNQVGDAPWPVRRTGLRQLLPACLLLLSDGAGAPAEITLAARAGEGGQVELELVLEPAEGAPPMPSEPPYRPLRAAEVQALARAEGLEFMHEGDTIRLRLPRSPD